MSYVKCVIIFEIMCLSAFNYYIPLFSLSLKSNWVGKVKLRISALKDGYGAKIDCTGVQGLIHQRQFIGKLGFN